MATLEDDGAAVHLKPGVALPGLPLCSTLGGSVSLNRLSGLNVAYFYPWTGRPGYPDPPNWDDIPGAHGSTPEAAGFRDCFTQFQSAGVGIFGISTQPTAYQSEFAERLGLPFSLLSDEAFALQQALSLPVFETGGVLYLKRLTLVIRDGLIESCVYPVSNPGGHAAEVLRGLMPA